MQAHILSVGNELLRGEVLDTNAHWLCQRLIDLGIPVQGRTTAPDKIESIAVALEQALRPGVSLVLVVGGLGPTVDDLTRDGIARALGLQLQLDDRELEALRQRFAGFGVEMPEQNRRQAEFPEGSEVIGNPWGSAPAFLVPAQGARVVAFPGVPREMKRIFDRLVVPRLREWFPAAVAPLRLTVRTFGVGESMLEDRVRDLIEKLPSGVSWSSLPRERGNCDLIITAAASSAEVEAACRDLHGQLVARLERHVYTTVPEVELDDVVHRLLSDSGWTLGLAESCTGGMASARLVGHPGCSKYLERALVTYSNQAKVDELGVAPATLERHGAVSEEVALEMAHGVRARAGTDIGGSVTGIAGPDGGSAEKPVGLVYYAVVAPGYEKVYRRVFPGDREQIRNRSADALLDALRLALQRA